MSSRNSNKVKNFIFFIAVAALFIGIVSCAVNEDTGDNDKSSNSTSTTSTISTTSTTLTTSTTSTTSTSSTTSTTIAPAIYVSTAGSDSNNGNPTMPVKTISKAVTMVSSSRNVIYIATGTYSELINIETTTPFTIKGGYNVSWVRANVNNKSTINGPNPTENKTGRITTIAGTKVTLENLDVKGVLYYNDAYGYLYAYGVVNNGNMAIDNCDIVAMESGSISDYAYGVYNNGSMLTINSGTITGAAGTASVGMSAYSIDNFGTLTINGGIITGGAGNASLNSRAYGVRNSNGIVTISNCSIYGKESTVTTNSGIIVLQRNGSAKFYQGTIGPATIENIKGDGTNIWNDNSFWDTP